MTMVVQIQLNPIPTILAWEMEARVSKKVWNMDFCIESQQVAKHIVHKCFSIL